MNRMDSLQVALKDNRELQEEIEAKFGEFKWMLEQENIQIEQRDAKLTMEILKEARRNFNLILEKAEETKKQMRK